MSAPAEKVAGFVEGRHFDVSSRGCWIWKRSTKNGYGQFSSGRYAHRHVYEATHGRPLPGVLVTHTCDERACIRPDHLVAGTKSTNILDVKRRQPEKWGRIQEGAERGRAIQRERAR